MIASASTIELNFAVPESPVIVSADVTLLEQALSNLVDNAIRYNRSGGHVAIVLDSGFVLRVVDDGPGVSEADMSRLTARRFRSEEARTRRDDGQGLGLAITVEALDRLGYTLTFSRPAEGGLAAEIRG
jgi:signal transduction histidine kinase